tara:strand:+ start:971 stop:1177 length:207 start_codon:yes stop_codon:yes gene_type:complete
LKKNIAKTIHWIGFVVFLFMLLATALDKSKDEVLIHLIASSTPLITAIIIRFLLTKEVQLWPFKGKRR